MMKNKIKNREKHNIYAYNNNIYNYIKKNIRKREKEIMESE